MKKISLLALVVAASLLGALAIGATSASAAVLCKTAGYKGYCGYENFYPKGTSIQAQLASGTNFTVQRKDGTFWTNCGAAKIGATLSNIGGLEKTAEATLNELTISQCGANMNVLEKAPSLAFGETSEGLPVVGSYTRIEITIPQNWGYTGTCYYWVLSDGGEIVGGNQLVFKEEIAYEAASNYFLCPKQPRYSATYNITTPTPLYHLKY